MLRKNLEVLGIKEIKTYNGGKITATNGMSKESAKAQSTPTTQHCTAVFVDGHTEQLRKCEIVAKAIEVSAKEKKSKLKSNLHKIIDKI